MDQIREQITQVMDRQGVLSRLKAELRANVFAAINEQDIAQGGIGLGGKSDPTHRLQLAADASGEVLVELVREFIAWCRLPFTAQVFEQEMQLGHPGWGADILQQRLGMGGVDQGPSPLLLQLLKAHLGSARAACASTADAKLVADDAAEASSTTLPSAGSRQTVQQQQQQQQQPLSREASAEAQRLQQQQQEKAAAASGTRAGAAAVAAVTAGRLSKSASLVPDAMADEESELIGTGVSVNDEESAAIFLPQRHSSASTYDGDEASSGSSTSPGDTPRLLARPARAAAAAAAAVPPGLPAPQHPAPAAAATAAAGADVDADADADVPAPGHHTTVYDEGGLAAACELSDSFGRNDRSLADSSYELRGLDSACPPAGPTGAQAAAGSGQLQERLPSRRGSSSTSSSRSLSRQASMEQQQQQQPAHAGPVLSASEAADGAQAVAAAALEPLPAMRPPGKLAPLPPVKPLGLAGLGRAGAAAGGSRGGSSSDGSGGVATEPPPLSRTSQGLREELIRSGLIAVREDAAQAGPIDGDGAGSIAGSTSSSPSGGHTAGRPAGAAAAVGGSDGGSVRGGGDDEDGDVDDDDDEQGGEVLDSEDDFEAAAQQQLFAAARRQLSQRSSLAELQQQQQQGVVVTGSVHARLSLSRSDSEDGAYLHQGELQDDIISEDISLPDMGLDGDDEDYGGAFAAPRAPAAAAVSTATSSQWTALAAPSNAAAAAGAPVGSRGGMTLQQPHTLELSEEDTCEVPLASAAGFVIEDDDF